MPLRCNSSEHIIGLIAGFSPLLHPTCLSELCQLPRSPLRCSRVLSRNLWELPL